VVANCGPQAVQSGHSLGDSTADLRVQPYHVPLFRAQGAWFEQHPLAYPELADVAEQRGEGHLLPFARLQAKALPHRLDVTGDLARIGCADRIPCGDRVGQHAYDGEVRAAELALKSGVLHNRPGVIAEREQHVVVELFKASGTICADDGALEVVVDVDRHGDEAPDFLVGAGRPVSRRVFTDDLVPLEDALSKALRDVAVRGVVVEALITDQVQPAVVVPIPATEEQALLGSNEFDRDS
jgi:hypothetical protein